MSDEPTPASAATDHDASHGPSQAAGAGASHVGAVGMLALAAYLIGFSLLLVYCLIAFWPAPAQATGPASATPVTFFGWKFSITDDVRLFLIVALSGALGSQVHTLRSFYWYIGNRELVLSWVLMYLLLPFVGGTLGLIFYFVIRGGFFSPTTTSEQTSAYGFVAMSGLVGLFSEQAVLKLKAVADTLFAKPRPGTNARPQEKE